MQATQQITQPVTQNEAKQRAEMLNFTSSNLTHAGNLNTLLPKSQINDRMQAAQASHKLFVDRLMDDRTKTPVLKKKLAAEHANSALKKVLKQADDELSITEALRGSLEQKVNKKMEIAGTTDLLIRTQQAALIQGMKWAELLLLVSKGDVGTAQALALPILQHKFQLNSNKERMDAMSIAVQQAVLGENYEKFTHASQATEAINDAGQAVVIQMAKNSEIATQISKTIVSGAES